MDKWWVENTLQQILSKLESTHSEIGARFPHICEFDTYNDENPHFWTNGFWPGILWLAYLNTSNEKYARTAVKIEEMLDAVLDGYYNVDHDAGFIWLLSAGADYRITGNESSKLRCLKAASYLASRFNIKGNFIQAWNHSPGVTIIDCCMNLPLLYWASKITGNPRFEHIARAHAETVVKYIVRPDGSVNHIVSFDAESGEFIKTLSGQASTENSAWSRGNAWAIYGLALSYRHTGEEIFLDKAKQSAHFFISNLPDDNVPYWDFRVEHADDTPRDTSAGACGACGLLEIAKHVPECEKAFYTDAAHRILKSLTENYSNFGCDKQCILNGGTGNFPQKRGINVGLIYGDYFYYEGICRIAGNDKIFWYEP